MKKEFQKRVSENNEITWEMLIYELEKTAEERKIEIFGEE